MKPVSLEFCGINSFSEPQKINFGELIGYGIFGIFGDTGSGKSTILDCIGFALYGDVARSRSGKIADIINYGSEKAFVNFEFDIDYAGKRRRYRVERELKRKNASQNLKVYEYDSDRSAFVCVADAVRQGNELLEEIVGLEQKDFEKCIALPQGEFAQFVKSTRSDRLKLVSRLFDLERYGEELMKRTNDAYKEAVSAASLAGARLEPYRNVSKEGVEALDEELAALEKAAEGFKKKLSACRAEEKRVALAYERSQQAKLLLDKYLKLQGELEEIERLEGELNKLGRAELVRRAEAERKEAARAQREAEEALALAQKKLAACEEAEKVAAQWSPAEAEKELTLLAGQRVHAEEREKLSERAAEIKAKLHSSREEYKKLKDRFIGFDYEAEKKRIEERIEELNADRADAKVKAALFRDEYATFQSELDGIGERYPETLDDVRPLAEKYRALSLGERVDFAAWSKENEAREKAQKRENEALRALEQKNGDYKAHLIRLKGLEEEGLRLKEELERNGQAMAQPLPTLSEIDRRAAERREEIKAHAREKEEAARESAAALSGRAVANERMESARKRYEEANARLLQIMREAEFSSCEEAEQLLNRYGDAERAKARVQKFREEYASAKAGYENGKDAPAVTEEELKEAEGALKAAEKESEECTTLIAVKKDALQRMRLALEEKRALEKENAAALSEKALCERLKQLFDGNKFMEFVAEEYLVAVAQNASTRLLTLTNGQYFLQYDKGFFVGDNLHGGALRGVNTLSGGEIFLVSLSLALALSAEICARSLRSSEFFFLDEGFGTLDAKLVDTVMDSLEKLRGEHFSIGIISHVEELKHRIGCKLTVKKATEKHGSQITRE